jgi:uncharacterized protein (TIRG00374 family)
MRYFKRYIGWIISLGCLYFVFRNLEWDSFATALNQLSPVEIFICIAIYLCGFILRGIRARLLFPALSLKDSIGAVFIGYAANNILPARLGEVVRAEVVSKRAKTSRVTTLSNIFLERILDGASVVFLLSIGALSLSLPPWAIKLQYTGIVIFGVLIASAFLMLRFGEGLFKKILPDKILPLVTKVTEGFSFAFKSVATSVKILLLSIAIWTFESAMFYFGGTAFNLPLTFFGAMFLMGVINLGVLIPSSPGNIGLFQYFTVITLAILSIPAPEATAFAVVIHVCQIVPVTLIGLWCLRSFGVSLRKY